MQEEAKNFRLLGHDRSAAWGGGSRVEVVNGHAYVGSIGKSGVTGIEGFTIHDVRDPRNPRKVGEFLAPSGTHMHKLRVVENEYLYVNSEKSPTDVGHDKVRPGFFIFDITKPSEPRQVGFYDMPGMGPHRFGVDNKLKLAFFPNDAEGWNGRVIWTMDISDPLKPEVVSVFGLPAQRAQGKGSGTGPMPSERAITLHGPPVIRGNQMYAAFWGGGVGIFDCTDLTDMKLLGHVCWSPPFVGSTHTAWPIGDRPYLVVTDEARAKQKYWDSQFMWIVDIRDPTNPLPVSTYFPDRETYFHRNGRFGAHNVLEYIPAEGPWANLAFVTFFNAGLRAVDVTDPLRPKEVGHYVPAVPEGLDLINSNDIGHDENGRLYLIDRTGAGMHILEYTG